LQPVLGELLGLAVWRDGWADDRQDQEAEDDRGAGHR
jgi:hypothetical protein